MTPDDLLELERLDTEVTQLRYRREHLDERTAHTEATTAMDAWEAGRTQLATRIAELGGQIESAEAEAAEVAAAKTRLEAQLKTVIAPREAEALMHEIATLDERRDTLDLAELTAMEEQTDLEAQLEHHTERHEALQMQLSQASSTLDTAVAAVDAEIESRLPRIAELRTMLTETEAARYDRLRAQLGGAVAKMEGRQCSGCHLELSAAEADDARDDAAATGVTDCPNCGRLLIIG